MIRINNEAMPSETAELSGNSVDIGEASDPLSNGDIKEGYYLRWSRLEKTVQVQEKSSGLLRGSIAAPTLDSNSAFAKSGPVQKKILCQVSGFAAQSQVLALMGPSGSGKTSLLNALSGRTSYDDGLISVNGTSITGNPSAMKRLMSKIAYVKQVSKLIASTRFIIQ